MGSFSPEEVSSHKNTFHIKGRQLCSPNAGFAGKGKNPEKNKSSCHKISCESTLAFLWQTINLVKRKT